MAAPVAKKIGLFFWLSGDVKTIDRFGPDGLTFPTMMNTATGQIDIFDSGTSSGQAVQSKMNNGNEYVRKLLKKRYDEFDTN